MLSFGQLAALATVVTAVLHIVYVLDRGAKYGPAVWTIGGALLVFTIFSVAGIFFVPVAGVILFLAARAGFARAPNTPSS